MRTIRILSLLFSLCQFLLILKLIEFVRGDPIPNSLEDSLSSQVIGGNERVSRHFFVAPNIKKKRKLKPWLTSSEAPTTDYPYDDSDIEETEMNPSQFLDRSGSPVGNSSVAENSTVPIVDGSDGAARLCPPALGHDNLTTHKYISQSSRKLKGCAGSQCGVNTSPYGFPVIEVFIAFVVGVIWFFIFLYVWYYFTKPSTSGYAASSGYGYGDSSGWSSSAGSSGSHSGSFWDYFIGRGYQRSFDGLNQLTRLVTDSLFKLSHLYNSL